MLKLKDIECLDNGSKLEKIELKLTEKIGRDTFRITDGDQDDHVLKFVKITLASQFAVGNSYVFRFLTKKDDRVLCFEKSLFEECKPIQVRKSYHGESSASASNIEYIKVKDLVGLEAKKFISSSLKVKVLQIEQKISKNSNVLNEVLLADLTGSTILTLWSNQAKQLSYFKVGSVVSLSSFVSSSWPKNDSEPKHISWDSYKGTNVHEVNDEDLMSINTDSFIKIIDGKLDMKNPYFYLSCGTCSKKLNDDKSCRNGCATVDVIEDFYVHLVVVNEEDVEYIKAFRKNLVEFEDISIELGSSFDTMKEKLLLKYSSIYNKNVQAKFKVARSSDKDNEIIKLEKL